MVNFIKPKYAEHAHQTKMCNDIFNGVDTAKQYLLQYTEEKNDVYLERQNSANLDNFVFRTIDTMKNIVFRKDIDVSGVKNAKMQEYLKKIDLSNNIDYFTKKVFENARKDGFTFIIADSQSYDATELDTQQKIEAAGIRPYLTNYKREDVINWQGNDINFSDWVVIRELITIDKEDFTEEVVMQYRVIYLDGRIRTYDEKGENFTEILTAPKTYPILVKVGKSDIPEFYDLTKINTTHLNANSERRNYSRIGGNPILGAGAENYDTKDAPKTLSISSGFIFDTHNWKVNWIEMTGQCDAILKDNIKDYEIAMMKQSVEFLTSDTNLTATQVNKESTPKESKLKSYATEVEDGINLALEKIGMLIDGGMGENVIVVNKDFDNTLITSEDAESYRQDYIQGIISLERLWRIYERGERLVPMTKKEEDAEKLILKDAGAEAQDI